MKILKIAGCSLLISVCSLAGAQVLVEEVPRVVDSSNQAGWWMPLALDGTTTYMAFNSPGSTNSNHGVKVGKRLSDGTWSFGILRDPNGNTWRHPDDIGHDQPTIAIDGDGFIHVFADMHNQPRGWYYFRSSAPGDLSNIRRKFDIPNLSSAGDKQRTYPVAATSPNGDIYLIIRNRSSGNGRGELFRFDNSSRAWQAISAFATGSVDNAVVYPDDVVVDDTGVVHIIFSFAAGSTSGLRHYGSYLQYRPATNSFHTINGNSVSTPVSINTPNMVFQGLEPQEEFIQQPSNTANSGKGYQTAKLALDNFNRPSITYRFRTNTGNGSRDFDLFRTRWNGFEWVQRTLLYNASDTIAGLGHTHDGSTSRSFFVTGDKQLKVAEIQAGGSLQIFDLAVGEPIERIAAIERSDGVDIVYATAPREIDDNNGRLYYLEVGDNITPTLQCLSGTQSGTQSGDFEFKNKESGQYLRVSNSSGDLEFSNTRDANAKWSIQDSDADGVFGITNVGTNLRLKANGATGQVDSDTGPFSDGERRWTLVDGNNDGKFVIRNVTHNPNQLTKSGAQVSLSGNPVSAAKTWEICK